MNWLLSILFLITIFFEFELIGYSFSFTFSYKGGILRNWIVGYFIFFICSMPLGLIAQFWHPSWLAYFTLQTLIYLILNAGCIFILYRRSSLGLAISCVRNFFRQDGWKEALCSNWFGLLFIVFVMYLLISNQLGVMGSNYDDYYYLGKMINLAGADNMFLENYGNGAILDPVTIDMARVINTYECTYAYLAQISGVYIPFFSRVTMSVVQLQLFYFLVREIAGLFVGRKKSQYAIVSFAVFLIPDTFWSLFKLEREVGIYSFDFWQFVNTPYYGSSVVRMSGLFSLFYFAIPLLRKIRWQEVVFEGIVILVLFSYSTIAFPVILFFTIGILIAKGITQAIKKFENKKYLYCLGIVILILSVLIALRLSGMFLTIPADKSTFVDSIFFYLNNHFSKDLLLKILPLLVICALFLFRKTETRSYVVVLIFIYWICRRFKLVAFLGMVTFWYDFVLFRTVSAMQMMAFLLISVMAMKLVENFRYSYRIIAICSSAFLIGMMGMFFILLPVMKGNDFVGGGTSPFGWKFDRILNFNSDMMPDSSRDIGEYFNSLPYGNYRLLTDEKINNGDGTYPLDIFNYASNRIEVITYRYENNFTTDTGVNIHNFIRTGKGDIDSVIRWLDINKVDYLLTENPKVKDLLTTNGMTNVHETKNPDGSVLYLLKNE